MHVSQKLPKWPMPRVVHGCGQIAVNPLVMKIVVDPYDIYVLGPSTQLRSRTAPHEVQGLKLCVGVRTSAINVPLVARARHDVDRRLRMSDTRVRVHVSHGFDACDGSPHEDRLQFIAAAMSKRIDVSEATPSPSPERDLVDRCPERHCIALAIGDLSGRAREGSKSVAEGRRPDVEIVRPTPVGDVPDHLSSRLVCSAKHREPARPVVMARSGFNQVPAQAVSDRPHPMLRYSAIVRFCVTVVSSCSDQVEAPAVPCAVRGALKAPNPEALEQVAVT